MTENLNIDKSTWKSVKLGDLLDNISNRVDDPSESEFDRFVGLQHFTSGELKIRDWSTTKSLSSSTKHFLPGDILFARRNAYLKRASMVEFEGVCSGDAFVLREDHNKVVAGLIAFIVNSDDLWRYANSNAAGTMSKRVKWKDLAKYEFLLPSIDQQSEIADLLWAVVEVIERNKVLLKNLNYYKKSYFKTELYRNHELKEFFYYELNPFFPVEKVGKYLKTVQYGISNSLSDEGDVPILRMNNLIDGKVDLTDLKYYSPDDGELDKFYLESGDVLFNRTNSFDLVGKTGIYLYDKKISFASYLIRIQTNREKLDSSFLNFYMNTGIGMSRIRIYRTPGVSQSNINAQNLKSMPIPVPPIEKQKLIMEMVNQIEKVELQTEKLINNTSIFLKSLINQIF